MRYLHSISPPVVHRDLRSPNVFLVSLEASLVNAKVADFGLSRKAVVALGDMLHTWQWLAPEVWDKENKEGYDERSDVYSFGIVLWEICMGPGELHTPFDEFERKEQYIKQAILHDNLRPTIPPETPHSVRQLIQQCWETAPDKRLTFVQVCQRLFSELGMEDEDKDKFTPVKYSSLEQVQVTKSFGTAADVTALFSTPALLWVGCADGSIRWYSVKTFDLVKQQQVFERSCKVNQIVLIGDRMWVASDDLMKQLVVFDLGTLSEEFTLAAAGIIKSLAFLPNGNWAAALSPSPSATTYLTLFPTSKPVPDDKPATITDICTCMVAVLGTDLWIGGTGVVHIFDSQKRPQQVLKIHAAGSPVLVMAATPTQVWCGADTLMYVWGTQNRDLIRMLDLQEKVYSSLAMPQTVWVGTQNRIRIFDATNLQPVRNAASFNRYPTEVSVLGRTDLGPDQHMAWTASRQTLAAWNMQTTSQVQEDLEVTAPAPPAESHLYIEPEEPADLDLSDDVDY